MSLVDEHPRVRQADEALADLQQRRDAFEARVAKLAEQDAKVQASYDKALSDALLTGAEMPEPPVLRLNGADIEVRDQFMVEQGRLAEQRSQAVASAHRDVLREARTQARELITVARPTVETLLAAMAELGTLLSAVKLTRDAANSISTERRSFHDSKLDVEKFVQLVTEAGDPLDSLDLVGGGGGRMGYVDPVAGSRVLIDR
jgi:hypothetical protein